MNDKEKLRRSIRLKVIFLILFIPVSVTILTIASILWVNFGGKSSVNKLAAAFFVSQDYQGAGTIPKEYIPIYIAAAEEYNVPWTLLAAHHRIETRFSTMRSDISPAGAEGPMQFMPCTFVGWNYPGCKGGLGKASIPKKEKTNLAVIKKYGGYGVDGNGDGVADPFQMEDAIFSAASYLADHGAAKGDIRKAIYHYNHSDKYVADVFGYYTEYEELRKQSERQARK